MEKEVNVDLFKALFANVNSQRLLKQLLVVLISLAVSGGAFYFFWKRKNGFYQHKPKNEIKKETERKEL